MVGWDFFTLFEERCGHVTDFGQWDVSGRDVCHFLLQFAQLCFLQAVKLWAEESSASLGAKVMQASPAPDLRNTCGVSEN